MIRHIIMSIFIFIVVSIVWGEKNIENSNLLCGPKSLLAVLEYNKIDGSVEELCELSGYNEKDGTTMMGLYQAAKAKGLPAVPLKLTWKKLLSIDGPKIIFVNGNHFCVIYQSTDKGVLLQNYPDKPKYVSKSNLLKIWQGDTLVFSEKLNKNYSKKFERLLQATNLKETPIREKGSNITFNKTKHDFGTVHEGETLSYIFTFTNTGKELLMASARSSCGCITSFLNDNTIFSGESGKLKVSLNTKGTSGNIQNTILFRTNDSEKKWIYLTVIAHVIPSVKVVPEQLYLSDVRHGEHIEREIMIIGGDNMIITGIDAPKEMEVCIGENSTSEKKRRIVPIYLTIPINQSPGKYERTISIHTKSDRSQVHNVTIRGTVLGEVSAMPPTIFFGEVKPDIDVVRETTLKSTNNNTLHIERVTAKSPSIITELLPAKSGNEYILRAILQNTKEHTTIRDSLHVYTKGNAQPVLEIPVYANVAGKND